MLLFFQFFFVHFNLNDPISSEKTPERLSVMLEVFLFVHLFVVVFLSLFVCLFFSKRKNNCLAGCFVVVLHIRYTLRVGFAQRRLKPHLNAFPAE